MGIVGRLGREDGVAFLAAGGCGLENRLRVNRRDVAVLGTVFAHFVLTWVRSVCGVGAPDGVCNDIGSGLADMAAPKGWVINRGHLQSLLAISRWVWRYKK